MNWSQAMVAMVAGKKVKSKDWHDGRWTIRENTDCAGPYTFSELQAMDWEIYDGEKTELVTAQRDAHRLFSEALAEIAAALAKLGH